MRRVNLYTTFHKSDKVCKMHNSLNMYSKCVNEWTHACRCSANLALPGSVVPSGSWLSSFPSLDRLNLVCRVICRAPV